MEYNRRKYISCIGKAGLGTIITPPFLIGCGKNSTPVVKDESE